MQSTSIRFRGDSYCGLYCGACEVLNLYREGLEQGMPANWEDLPRQLKEVVPQMKLVCTGCKTKILSAGCKKCPIRICASSKKVEACVTCPEFPCKKIKERQTLISSVLKDKLPHTKVKFQHSDLIREKGFERWCQEQEKRWSCPRCGTAFTWYQASCRKCGYYLDPLKVHNNLSI